MAEHAEAAKPDVAEKKQSIKKESRAVVIKERTFEKEYKDLIHRLNRIEGQIRGIRNMVEQDAYCPDILIQVAAANAALNSFNKVLLGNHLRTCVANDIREGHDETIDELLKVLQRLMK
ncbi:MAG: metal-sensing transcriptional repressor [Clostridium sp.]